MRDRLLDVAGLLERGAIGGPSEDIATPEGGSRRTLYAHIDRQNLPGLFRTFDFASPDAHSPERPHTLVPQQALYLMNSPVLQRSAEAMSRELAQLEPGRRIDELYRRVLARDPREEERVLAEHFLARGQPAPIPPGAWQFGYGAIAESEAAPRVRFAPLEHFAANRWQGAASFPDPQLGYVCVTPDGGHPGNSAECCAIRRWTAPDHGDLALDGQLQRPEQQGDGIDGVLISSTRGEIARWTVPTGSRATHARVDDVRPGEVFDLVVTCRDDSSYDTFHWKAEITLETKTSRRTWSSVEGFQGPAAPPLDLFAQLAQVLLASNEFLYVD